MTTDRDPIWDTIKERAKAKFDKDRARFLAEANATNEVVWTKHTEYHWSRMLAGTRLDYWPSRKKFQHLGRVMRGDVAAFIRKTEEKSS